MSINGGLVGGRFDRKLDFNDCGFGRLGGIAGTSFYPAVQPLAAESQSTD